MNASNDSRRTRVFGTFADDYDKRRSGFPGEAIDWLVPPGATAVAHFGAGTGKRTGLLLGCGLIVTAVEPDAAMLEVLAEMRRGAIDLCSSRAAAAG